MTDLDFTGERVVPGKSGESLWYEHIARYNFAADYVRDRRVLDAGCGTGYGADLLAAQGAASVLGIDASPAAIDYARSHYRRPNLKYRVADVLASSVADRSYDVVVSFEVIEHLAEQERFVREVDRVLSDEGVFVVSTPNRISYQDRLQFEPNPFHVCELDRIEFTQLLSGVFPSVMLFVEDCCTALTITPLRDSLPAVEEAILDRSLLEAAPTESYFIALCSRSGMLPRARTKVIQFSDAHYDHLDAAVWLHRLDRAKEDVRAHVPLGESVIVVEGQDWGVVGAFAGRRAVPFLERDGEYWGAPPDEETAISELERMRQEGFGFLVVGWPAFWWLEYYRDFAAHLRNSFECAVANDRVIVFDLGQSPPRNLTGS